MFTATLSLIPFVLMAQAATVKSKPPQYTATYTPGSLPNHTEMDQLGTNNCGTGSSPTSLCQNAYINSIEDFCLWAPPYSNGKNATIGETERYEVAWCLKDGYGTRLIPDGTITGAHWIQTPDYVQITGVGDMTKLGIPHLDYGGELDPHGADGNGNPEGGLVFGNSFGTLQQYHEWLSFISFEHFCFKACKDGPNAPHLCNHIYDVLDCDFNVPGNYAKGSFDSCLGDTALPAGIYGTSTFRQGDPVTPQPHPIPSSSFCTTTASLTQSLAAASPSVTVFTSGSSVITETGSPSAAAATATTTSSASGASSHISGSWWTTVTVGAVGLMVGAVVVL